MPKNLLYVTSRVLGELWLHVLFTLATNCLVWWAWNDKIYKLEKNVQMMRIFCIEDLADLSVQAWPFEARDRVCAPGFLSLLRRQLKWQLKTAQMQTKLDTLLCTEDSEWLDFCFRMKFSSFFNRLPEVNMAHYMPRAHPNTYGQACKRVLPLRHITVKCMVCASWKLVEGFTYFFLMVLKFKILFYVAIRYNNWETGLSTIPFTTLWMEFS